MQNRRMLPFVPILNQHWNTIMEDATLRPIHQEKPTMAFKPNRNIGDTLVHSKVQFIHHPHKHM